MNGLLTQNGRISEVIATETTAYVTFLLDAEKERKLLKIKETAR